MVNGDMSALLDAQAVLQEAGITTETRLLEDESVTGALCRYADALDDIDLTVMGACRHSVTAILYWQPHHGNAV